MSDPEQSSSGAVDAFKALIELMFPEEYELTEEEKVFTAWMESDNEGKGFKTPEDRARLADGSEAMLTRIEADMRERPNLDTEEELVLLARGRQLIATLRG